jgi:hypothetical protein
MKLRVLHMDSYYAYFLISRKFSFVSHSVLSKSSVFGFFKQKKKKAKLKVKDHSY